MPFTKELPEWGNAGQRPPQSSIDEGYKPMDHPPADWFNWYQYTAYHALKELQEIGATQDDVSTALKTAKAYTDEFAARRDNPNQVTKGQVGLGNVDNVQQATKAEFNAHNTDSTRHITSTERSNWNAKETTTGAQNKADTAEKNAKTYTDQHINDKSNPHGVTKDQVGLSNVTNDKQATKTEFDAHNYNQIRHISDAERTKWNASQLSKISSDDGQPLFNITTDVHTELLNYPNFTYFSYAGTAKNSPGASGRGLWTCSAGKSYGHVLVMTNDNKTYRKSLANSVWTDWIEIESTEGAQKKVDAHANQTDIHVTKSDKDKWNGAQLFKITNDVGGVLVSIADTDDFLDRIVKAGKTFGTFYSTGNPVNAPSTLSTRGFFHFTSLDSNGNGTFGYVIAIDYKNNMYSNYVDGNLGWSGWKRLLTENDTDNVPWLNVPYKNGATSGDRPLQYRKVGNTLHLNGHVLTEREIVFASIPSSSAPSKGVVKLVATSGTTGYSKIIIHATGDMRLTGVMAKTESNVNGYYIDLAVPLT
ncbi:hypothetical protein ACR6EC_21380 [Bacillus subtilis]|uniref:hypothetical protein n=1 Tax=Bacillus subtilis TaxID=1423 RepID=UPI002149F351|nr:hypothetical protein [Bacillus subtilis]MCR1994443.1 hypothetical protein [Bacillus subtilis]